MARVVPPTIDKRNEVQRELDTAVRGLHKWFGDSMRGFAIVAFGEDTNAPQVGYCMGDIPADEFADYVADGIEARMHDED